MMPNTFTPKDDTIRLELVKTWNNYWETTKSLSIRGQWIKPRFCHSDLQYAIGKITGEHLTLILSKKPIPDADWNTFTVQIRSWKNSYTVAEMSFGVEWAMGHPNHAYNTFMRNAEKLFLDWLGKEEGVYHLCYAAWDYDQ